MFVIAGCFTFKGICLRTFLHLFLTACILRGKILIMRLGLPLTHIEYEYSQKMLDGFIDYVKQTGESCLVFVSKQPGACETDFAYQEWSVSKFFNKKNIDGLLMPTAALCRHIGEPKMIEIVKQYSKKLPTFSVITEIEGIPSLIVDSTKTFRTFVSHLIEKHNKKSFAFMGINCKSEDILLRYKIFKEVLSEHDIPFDKNLLLFGDYTVDSSITVLEKNFKRKEDVNFDALICVTDEMALGAIEYLTSIGLDVPGDVAVTGFDNTFRSNYCFPSLSTVDQRVSYQIYSSAMLLRDMVNGKEVPPLSFIHSSCCMRASCGCLDKYDTRYLSVDENGTYTPREDKFFNDIAFTFFDKRDQNLKILNFVEELHSNLSLERLVHRLERHLLDFDIKQCAICLYRQPVAVLPNEEYNLPDEAYIYYLKNQKQTTPIVDDQNFFDCSESLLPDNKLDDFTGVQIVKMIYHGEYQYGYMIMSFDAIDCTTYQLIFSLLSKFIASAYDVTMSERQQSNLQQMNLNLSILSKTDEMTGILNRRGFLFAAQQQLNIAASLEQTGLVIYGDMDGLKYINDTFGHDAGDRAILAEVELLSKTFRTADIIGRLGGDEFAILSVSLSMQIFEKLKQRLDLLCSEWNAKNSEPFKLSISLGAVEFDKDNYNLLELLKKADAEQYKEKRGKKESRK